MKSYYNNNQNLDLNMKTINHPSPQLKNYNKVLQFLDFPISFCFAIQNLWITALMIAYETPNLIDAFIWILPNVIAIIVRPFLIRYVHQAFSTRQAQIALISHFLFGGMIGCSFISISSQYFEDNYRIIVCVLGWTTMDVCFEMALFFGQKTKQRLAKLGYSQIQDDKNYSSIIGEALGYTLSSVLCFLRGGKVMKKFFMCSSTIYLVAAMIAGGYWLMLYLASKDSLNLQLSKFQNNQSPTSLQLGLYLPGYYELKRSSGFDRWLLTLHFTFLYTVDILLIYGSMWVIIAYQQLGEKQGSAYYAGMRQGGFVLLTFSLFSFANLLKIFTNKIGDVKALLKYLIYLLIVICMVSSLLFYSTQYHCIFGLAALIGTVDGLYNNDVEPKLSKEYPVFESCKQIVDRIQKLFVLCPMPFFIMIVLGRGDISDCLLSLPIAVAILLLLSRFWKQNSESLAKSRKINKKH